MTISIPDYLFQGVVDSLTDKVAILEADLIEARGRLGIEEHAGDELRQQVGYWRDMYHEAKRQAAKLQASAKFPRKTETFLRSAGFIEAAGAGKIPAIKYLRDHLNGDGGVFVGLKEAKDIVDTWQERELAKGKQPFPQPATWYTPDRRPGDPGYVTRSED